MSKLVKSNSYSIVKRDRMFPIKESIIDSLPTLSELRKAREILKDEKTRLTEDERNKAKKLQKIIGDHESIIQLIRLKMKAVGFPSKQTDFYENSLDIRFLVPKSKVSLFWVEFKKVLKDHVLLKALKKDD